MKYLNRLLLHAQPLSPSLGEESRRCTFEIVAAVMALALLVDGGSDLALADGMEESGMPGALDPAGSSWKVERVRIEHDNADIFTLSNTVDITRSDPGIAGLTILCNKDGLRTAVVVIEPFPPHAHPHVTVSADDATLAFDADVISPGAQLLLSFDIRRMLAGAWSRSQELTVKIADGSQTLKGVVTLVGIKAGLATLLQECSRT